MNANPNFNVTYKHDKGGRNSVKYIVDQYRLAAPGFEPRRGRDLSDLSKPAPRPSQRVSFPGVKELEFGADQPPLLARRASGYGAYAFNCSLWPLEM